jgi:hypothetical protein
MNMDQEIINIIFNDEELNKIDSNLCLLPDELKRDIVEKHFYPNRLVVDLLKELESHESKTLNIINLLPILRKVLEDPLAIAYLLENYIYTSPYYNYKKNIFKELYDSIIINKNKTFVLIEDPVEDFALNWLFTMYK